MKGSNSLTSHCPERSSHPANKMIPKDELKYVREGSGKGNIASAVLKKMHIKKSRAFNKNINNFL